MILEEDEMNETPTTQATSPSQLAQQHTSEDTKMMSTLKSLKVPAMRKICIDVWKTLSENMGKKTCIWFRKNNKCLVLCFFKLVSPFSLHR